MKPNISPASEADRHWASNMLASTEPWISLGVKHEQLLKTCFDPEYQVYIAQINGTPCGVLIVDPRGIAGSPYIKTIAVAAEFRSSGIGASMIAFAESYFQKQSRHMFLCVSSFNLRARAFYGKLGYEQVGEFKDYIIAGESEILMYKCIA